MDLKDYTVHVVKYDRRYRDGEFTVAKYDYKNQDYNWMLEEMKDLRTALYPDSRYRLELVETMVTKTNLMTGKEYQERYDTPISCSPASDTFWSM